MTRRNSRLSLEPSCFLVTTPVRFLMSMVKMLRGMSSTGPCVTSSSIYNRDLRIEAKILRVVFTSAAPVKLMVWLFVARSGTMLML